MTNQSSSTPTPPATRFSAELRASAPATASFGARFEERFEAGYFRASPFREGLNVSSIGLGTYLGDSTAIDDVAYEAALRHAILSGINLIDTAINYRNQRSELAIGAAIQRAIGSGEVARGELVICSKGGYVPLDRTPPATREEYQAYVRREFIDPRIVQPDEIVAGGHSLAPRFLRYCIAKSRQNLGVHTIDVYYLHNPEQQLASVSADELRARLRAAFVVLEESVSRGEIGVYGCATWDGLRVAPGAPSHLSLEEMVAIAQEIGGDRHKFRAVQLPINLAMPEAVRDQTQPLRGKLVTLVEAAADLGLAVVASATLMQGQLTRRLPEAMRGAFPRCTTDAQRAIAFTRTLPGVAAALVGMRRVEHVDENLGAARR